MCSLDTTDFYQERAILMEKENNEYLGSDLILSPSEITANTILMKDKQNEIMKAFDNHNNTHKATFPPSHSFLTSRPAIEQSKVFEFIRKLPKGMNFN